MLGRAKRAARPEVVVVGVSLLSFFSSMVCSSGDVGWNGWDCVGAIDRSRVICMVLRWFIQCWFDAE